MIEHVIGLDSQLDVTITLSIIDSLEERNVPVVDAWSAHDVRSGIIADAAARSLRHALRVDVSQNRTFTPRQVRIAEQNNARPEVLASGGLPVALRRCYAGQRVTQVKRRPDAEARQA